MMRARVFFTAATVVLLAAGCGGGGERPPSSEPVTSAGSTADTPNEASSDEPTAAPVEVGGSAPSSAPKIQSSGNALKGLNGRGVPSRAGGTSCDVVQSGQPCGEAQQAQAPQEGQTVWGQDNCLWTVVQGYWVQGSMCRSPDTQKADLWYYYNLGTQPSQWWQVNDVSAAQTGNGTYYVFFNRGAKNWGRCIVSQCANANSMEIYDGAWLTADQYAQTPAGAAAVAAQQQMQQAQQQGVQNAQQAWPDVVEAQGGTIGGGILGGSGGASEFGLQIQQMMNDFNRKLAETTLAPACNSSYNGCA